MKPDTNSSTGNPIGGTLKKMAGGILKNILDTSSHIPSSAEKTNDQLSVDQQNQFPVQLWDYLTGDRHKHFAYMPGRSDRDGLHSKPRRQEIWDYFFRFNPEDIERPFQKEISHLLANKRKAEEDYQKEIINIENHEKKLKAQDTKDAGAQIDIDQELLSLSGRREQEKKNHEKAVAYIEQQVEVLRNTRELLLSQIPSYVSDEEIINWLDEDIEKLRGRIKKISAVGTQLTEIAIEEDNSAPIKVDNPILFISPAELQTRDCLPEYYLPPQIRLVDVLHEVRSDPGSGPELASMIIKGESPLNSHPDLIPDRARHLSARRQVVTEEGTKIVFGVYFLEAMLISIDMITIYSLFFDFINGNIFSENISEQYYQDIVAIEQSHEFRTVPINLVDDTEVLNVEDAPVIKLVLSSGDRRTITFPTQRYYQEIHNIFNMENKTEEKKNDSINQILDHDKLKIESAIKVLRKHIREHKCLMLKS